MTRAAAFGPALECHAVAAIDDQRERIVNEFGGAGTTRLMAARSRRREVVPVRRCPERMQLRSSALRVKKTCHGEPWHMHRPRNPAPLPLDLAQDCP